MTDDRSRRGTVSILRRVIVGVIIGSFSLAALGGIVALLGGELNETAWRVLSTTAIVGAFSVAVLCCVALVGRRLQPFGLIGAAVSIATAGFAIALVWSEWDWPDELWQITWSGIAMTAAFSLASLLLLLADRDRSAVRIGLIATLGLFAVVLGMVLYVIWWPDRTDGEIFPRVLGIAAILAALGAVVVPVISLLLRDRSAASGIAAETHARLERAARERGTTADALLSEMLTSLPPVPRESDRRMPQDPTEPSGPTP
ncbi:hypothetical protein [Microbacterium sp. SLBN-146]|uniref:hypothetical protein n=1 Tax=Microbacterium sp. SLBN-146 TaxID=2768457 RepID=UPI00114D7487|nr:hypothetical protein [Microbacterium sp. SLBN-146]TQJ32533.1 hypothetical protein FBY39_3044 [Microbacterium sp. SLBN-146]